MFSTFLSNSSRRGVFAIAIASAQVSLVVWADKSVAAAGAPSTVPKKAAAVVTKNLGDVQCLRELDTALSQLQHKAPGPANAALDRALKLIKAPVSKAVAIKLAATLNAYMKNTDAGSTFDAGMKLITIGGGNLFEQIDDDLEQIANDQIDSGNLVNAEALMKARIRACKSSNDERMSDWYLRLSEVELTLGNTDESDRLFDMVEKLYVAHDDLAERVLSKKSNSVQKRNQVPSALDAVGTYYSLKHGLSAPLMEFGEDTTIQFVDSSENKLLETKLPSPDIYCSDTIHCKGSFKFGGLILVDRLIPDTMRTQASFRLEKVAPEPAPPVIAPGPEVKWIPLNQEGTLLPGTYKTNTCAAINAGQLSGRTKVYLVDDAKSPPEFDIKSISPQTEYAYDLQIIYNGTRSIKISNVIGVIYAPNASVELSGAFSGAIIAKKLTTADYSRLFFDQNLVARSVHQ